MPFYLRLITLAQITDSMEIVQNNNTGFVKKAQIAILAYQTRN